MNANNHRYYGKISCTIDKEHPDIGYIKDWTEDKFYVFDDEYTFDDDYTEEEIALYIKRDLSLVAGGGYNTNHIHNVVFEIKRI